MPPGEFGSRFPIALRWISRCLREFGTGFPEIGFRFPFETRRSRLPVAHLKAIDVWLSPAPSTGPVLDRDQPLGLQILHKVSHLTIRDAAHRRQPGLARKAGGAHMNVLRECQEQQPGRTRHGWQRPDPLASSTAHENYGSAPGRGTSPRRYHFSREWSLLPVIETSFVISLTLMSLRHTPPCSWVRRAPRTRWATDPRRLLSCKVWFRERTGICAGYGRSKSRLHPIPKRQGDESSGTCRGCLTGSEGFHVKQRSQRDLWPCPSDVIPRCGTRSRWLCRPTRRRGRGCQLRGRGGLFPRHGSASDAFTLIGPAAPVPWSNAKHLVTGRLPGKALGSVYLSGLY